MAAILEKSRHVCIHSYLSAAYFIGKFNCKHEDHMEKHIKEHLEGRLTCEDCQKVFSHKLALVNHRYSEHLKKV